jgi:hypothetical protein
MKIIDIVKFNSGHAYVFDEIPEKLYEKHGNLLIGIDDSKTIVDCLHYQYPVGRKEYGAYAFGGREFDLPLKDGGSVHCWGQYWQGRSSECAKVLGFDICGLTASTKQALSKCYVFCGYYANKGRLEELINQFMTENPSYQAWEYWDYGKHLKGDTP